MTSDDSLIAGTSPEAARAQTLGKWVTTLAEDALCVVEVSQQFAPGAPLRAPLRAGLRHLLHIERLSRGIEGLAMLEVSIMLRVTALLASPAQELDSETVLRLRADTPLIEELFPDEKDGIWRFCQSLIETERSLPSEQPGAFEVATPVAADPASGPNPELSDVADAVHTSPIESDGVGEIAEVSAPASPIDVALEEADDALPTDETEHVASDAHSSEPGASDAARHDAAVASPPPVVTDELAERIRAWAAGYKAPTFGAKPHDLTRACAFVRTRVSAWTNS